MHCNLLTLLDEDGVAILVDAFESALVEHFLQGYVHNCHGFVQIKKRLLVTIEKLLLIG